MMDLSTQPYADYVSLLKELLSDVAARERIAVRNIATDRGTHDANGQERLRVAFILHLEQTDDLELVRYMLDEEIEARKTDSFQGAGDALTLLSLRLLELSDGDLDDVWRFWRAKTANFDTFAGGYDIEFVFALRPTEPVRSVLETFGSSDDLEMFDRYDPEEVVAELPRWRARLAKYYPTDVADFTHHDAAHIAEAFGDTAAYEHHSLQLAESAKDRAYIYRNLERFESAVRYWREAAGEANTDWDRASLLIHAITDAARVPMDARADVAQLDALRSGIPSWNEVGLGRMATQACYEWAATSVDADAGREVFQTAQRWRDELASFTLVGLEAAVAAAERWGAGEELRELQDAALAERRRIDQLLAD